MPPLVGNRGWRTTIKYLTFRLLALACAPAVAGIVGRSITRTQAAGAYIDGRMIYTIVVAGLAIFDNLMFIIPINVYCVDFLLFILWIVDAGLLIHVSCHVQLEKYGKEKILMGFLIDQR
jgi:hypothetical protein